ncbi:MAG: hypothetical protein WED10_12575 [Brumimicrobium sp.]
MEKITNLSNVQELNASIYHLENKRARESDLLKEQFNKTYNSLKPINLVRSTFKEFVSAPDVKEDLLKSSIGLASGYLSKKVVIGSSSNPIKQILGSVLQMGVTNIVSKNADGIKSKFADLIGMIFKKKER